MIKVLLSSYCCAPDRGSEFGVGWNWAINLADYVNLTVLTRKNNQAIIEEWIDNNKGFKSKIKFIFYDPPKWLVYMYHRGFIPTQIFYVLWQMRACRKCRSMGSYFDIVHHVSFNTMLVPGFWWDKDKNTILGPLGGTSTVRADFRKLFGFYRWLEISRSVILRNWNRLPWVRISFNRAKLILCANRDTELLISELYSNKVACLLETGIRREDIKLKTCKYTDDQDEIHFIWVGNLIPRKACYIALRAIALAVEYLESNIKIVLDIVGDGPLAEECKKQVIKLGIDNHVVFHGAVRHQEAKNMIRNSDALIFTSIRDTSGNVVLEAMCESKPVICFNHQGVADITDDKSAIRITPGNLESSVDDFAEAIVLLAKNSHLRQKMGLHGRSRILENYMWDDKAKLMFSYYERISNDSLRV